MNLQQFEACAKLIRSRDPGKEGARMTLVEGLARSTAAIALDIPGETISKAARRILDADAIIREAYDINYSKEEILGMKISRDEKDLLKYLRNHFKSIEVTAAEDAIIPGSVVAEFEPKEKTFETFIRLRLWEQVPDTGDYRLRHNGARFIQILGS